MSELNIYWRQSLNTSNKVQWLIRWRETQGLRIPGGYTPIAQLILGGQAGASSGVYILKLPLSSSCRKSKFHPWGCGVQEASGSL